MAVLAEPNRQDLNADAAIIVLNWNGWQDTIECLESLQRLTHSAYQIIVVDNGSTDGSVDKIRAWARGELAVQSPFYPRPGPKPVAVIEYTREEAERGGDEPLEASALTGDSCRRLVLIRNDVNLGFAAGTNVGLRYALKRGYRYLGPLNNDTVVPPDYLTRLLVTLDHHKELMAVSPKILYKDDPSRIFLAGGWIRLWRSGVGYLGHRQRDSEAWTGVRYTDFVSGCCFLARRKLFEVVGCFDEDFFFGYEEVVYSYVARKRGFLVGMNLDAVIYHKHGGSYGDSEEFRIYYIVKYHLLMYKKHGTLGEKIFGLLVYFLVLAKEAATWVLQGRSRLIRPTLKGLRDFFIGHYGKSQSQG